MMYHIKLCLYVLLGSVLFIVDRLIKSYALIFFSTRYSLNSWCACELSFNRGISYGLFYSENSIFFWSITALTIILTGVILTYAFYRAKKGFSIFGEVFVLAGALSNICDRFLYQGVIDFIELS